ncbi:hypothetical protein PR048_015764 [Dryococelus australis]|uniref:Uncharacterized protein n=1 Tax=Dryococelus australis TaxID=614101 RepID=A0ABQ9HHW9_9NEOP|nr:hypothetical protein PR048_015764 [Dryococelus australis]
MGAAEAEGLENPIVGPQLVRAGFLGNLPCIPPLHSGFASYSPRFTLVGSQDLDLNSRPNLSTPLNQSVPVRVALARSPMPPAHCRERVLQCQQTLASKGEWRARVVSALDKAHYGQLICRPNSDRVNVTSLDAEFRKIPRPQERPNVDRNLSSGGILAHCRNQSSCKITSVHMSLVPRENPLTGSFVRHDSHMRKSRNDPAGNGLGTCNPEARTEAQTKIALPDLWHCHVPSWHYADWSRQSLMLPPQGSQTSDLLGGRVHQRQAPSSGGCGTHEHENLQCTRAVNLATEYFDDPSTKVSPSLVGVYEYDIVSPHLFRTILRPPPRKIISGSSSNEDMTMNKALSDANTDVKVLQINQQSAIGPRGLSGWTARLPPWRTRFNPGWVTPDFRKWESCRTMSLVGVFSRESPVSSILAFSPLFSLTGSQDPVIKSRPIFSSQLNSTVHNTMQTKHTIDFERLSITAKFVITD